MKTKLNLRHRDEGKVNIGCSVYMSDKLAFDAIARQLGITTSLLMRSLINDVLDNKIEIEI